MVLSGPKLALNFLGGGSTQSPPDDSLGIIPKIHKTIYNNLNFGFGEALWTLYLREFS